jgi:hypothetical protein
MVWRFLLKLIIRCLIQGHRLQVEEETTTELSHCKRLRRSVGEDQIVRGELFRSNADDNGAVVPQGGQSNFRSNSSNLLLVHDNDLESPGHPAAGSSDSEADIDDNDSELPGHPAGGSSDSEADIDDNDLELPGHPAGGNSEADCAIGDSLLGSLFTIVGSCFGNFCPVRRAVSILYAEL